MPVEDVTLKTTLIQTVLAAPLGLTVTTVCAQVPNNDGHLFDTHGVVEVVGPAK